MKKLFLILIFFIFSFNEIFAKSKLDTIVAERIEAVSTININYDDINSQLSELEKILLSKNVTVKNTNDYIKILNNIENQILSAKNEDETNLNFVKKRIESLGERPTNNSKEDITLINRINEFDAEEKILKSKIAKNDLILIKIDELEKVVLSIRNRNLFENIFSRQANILNSTFFIENTKNFIKISTQTVKTATDYYNSLNSEQQKNNKDIISNISLISIFSIVIGIIINISVKKYFNYYKVKKHKLDYINKMIFGVSFFISKIIAPTTIIGALLFFFNKDNANFNLIFREFLIYIFIIYVLLCISSLIFSPRNSDLRLINIDDSKAKSINCVLFSLIILIFAVSFFKYLAIKLEYHSDFVIYLKALSCLIKILCIAFFTKIFFSEPEEENSEDTDNASLSIKTKIKILIYLFSVIIFFICFTGYVNLAYYILNKTLFSAIFIGIAYIISNVVSVFFHRFLLLKFWTKSLKINRKQINKFDIVLSLIINPIILIFLIFSILGVWGVSINLLLQNIKNFLTSFYIGDVKISIISIFTVIITFFISLTVFKIIKIKLLTATLSKTDMDDGVKDSISSGFSFFGFLASGFFAIAVVGGNFSNLAIIAGALSFGVGLGLQNIINNFVSGILILFERPIRIGDIVNINGQEGVVRQINIRSTLIETGTKDVIIIPNSNIISGIVLNKTLNNKQTRIDLNFTFDSENNPETIIEILLYIANNNQRIMQKPAPFVAFNNFTNNILDFTLKFYISDINNQQSITNEIMITAFNKFREMNIKLQKQTIYIENKQQN